MKKLSSQLKNPFLLVALFIFVDFAYAQNSFFYYSFSADPWTFNRRNDDGSALVEMYTPASYQINESAVDGSIGKVYFYETTSNYIFKSNLDGSNRATVFTGSTSITSLAAGNGYVFYAYLNSPYSVRRFESSGSGDKELYVNPSYGNVLLLAFDAANNYLYYYEGSYDNVNNRIFRTDADGNNFTVVYNNCPTIISLAAGAGYFYYAYSNSPWTFNRRNADGTLETGIYTPPDGTVNAASYDASINKLFFYDNNVSGVKTVYKSNLDGTSLSTVYSGFSANIKSISTPTAPSIAFTDGSGYTQNISSNSSNQVVGQFYLASSIYGATLTSASIKLNNTRTGLSNFKLWSSTDASFGSDSQLGSTVVADPGTGNSVLFNNFSSVIGTSGVYYFLTADVAAEASGTVQAVISQNSSFTFSSGILSGSISDAVLSNNSTTLPVELISFTANVENNRIILEWKTATEVNNYGFEIERNQNDWQKLGFVQGAGNSNSPKSYSFEDSMLPFGEIKYRLKQINFDGTYEYSQVIKVNMNSPKQFNLAQNYPNPFNPETTISYEIPVQSSVTLSIYDMLGNKLVDLINETKQPGSYNVLFSLRKYKLSSGIYFYRLKAGDFIETKKLILIK